MREEIRARLEVPAVPVAPDAGPGAAAPSAGGHRLLAVAPLSDFYERRAYEPAWTTMEGARPAARELLATIRRADLEGLEPSVYHRSAIAAALQRIAFAARSERGPDPRELADLDLLLTDAYLAYATHLVAGVVDPVTLDAHWSPSARDADLPAHLETALRRGRVAESIRDLFFSSHPGYFRLRSALARYRALAEGGGWPTLPEADTTRPGTRGPAVAALRRRLEVTDDLPSPTEGGPSVPADSFDAVLAEGVKRFQRRHGLDPDGVVGAETRAALDVPAARRVRQIELNLERWRWMPRQLGFRYVLVNIAEFAVEVMEPVEPVLRMKAIVGQRYRQTPVFSDTMRYLVLNPSWTLPPLIAVEDKLPLIRRDPGYLARNGYRLYAGWGRDAPRVDPDTIDWSSMTPGRFRGFRLYQEPGPHNALGRVKFMFPNRFDVYLHDTPERELFRRTVRTFSSGCIRVERPLDLAEHVLRGDSTWTRERIEAVLRSRKETTVSLPEPIPVHIQYWTAWTDPDGTVHFSRDLYGRDRELEEALEHALGPAR